MHRRIAGISLAVALALSGAALGCQDEGPAERLGQAIDEAAEDASKRVKKETKHARSEASEALDKAVERQ